MADKNDKPNSSEIPDLPLFRYPHSPQTGAYKPPRRPAREMPKHDCLPEQKPAEVVGSQKPRRLLGIRKRWMAIGSGIVLAGSVLYPIVGPMVRKGVVDFGGDYVRETLEKVTNRRRPKPAAGQTSVETKPAAKPIETGSITKEQVSPKQTVPRRRQPPPEKGFWQKVDEALGIAPAPPTKR